MAGVVAVGAMATIGVVTLWPSELYNSTGVGDCLNADGLESDCSGVGADYAIVQVKLYSQSMPYPGEARFDLDSNSICPDHADYVFFPTRETWSDGDRSLLCVTER